MTTRRSRLSFKPNVGPKLGAGSKAAAKGPPTSSVLKGMSESPKKELKEMLQKKGQPVEDHVDKAKLDLTEKLGKMDTSEKLDQNLSSYTKVLPKENRP